MRKLYITNLEKLPLGLDFTPLAGPGGFGMFNFPSEPVF